MIKNRRHKMNAIRSVCGQGHNHPSKGESRRCDVLHLMQRAGEISDLRVQPSIQLVPGFLYAADFSYLDGGRAIVEDWKGLITQRFRDICRMWPHHGDGVLRVTGLSGGRTVVTREIEGAKNG